MEEQNGIFLEGTDSFLVWLQGNIFQCFLIIRYSNRLHCNSSYASHCSELLNQCFSMKLHDRHCQVFYLGHIYLGSTNNYFGVGFMCLPALISLSVNILQERSSSSTHLEWPEISLQIWCSAVPSVSYYFPTETEVLQGRQMPRPYSGPLLSMHYCNSIIFITVIFSVQYASND